MTSKDQHAELYRTTSKTAVIIAAERATLEIIVDQLIQHCPEHRCDLCVAAFDELTSQRDRDEKRTNALRAIVRFAKLLN